METKFCLVGEIGGKASLAQVPHAVRAITGGSGVNEFNSFVSYFVVTGKPVVAQS